MKRVGNLYQKITDIKNIKEMYDKKIKVNTKNKSKIERFDEHYTSNLARIKYMLDNKIYKPYKYNIFLVREPKVRLIMAQSITDKIVNHLVSKYFLIDIFDKVLIDNNIATRVGKGTHVGIKKVKICLKDNINKDLYILKFDIKKYFFNLDHDILKRIIRSKIKDVYAINILDTIIDSTDYDYINEEIIKIKEREINKINNSNSSNKDKLIEEINSIPLCRKGVGCSIGNLSSQSFAIIYLHELDKYVTEVLKPYLYIRYNDDGLLISDSIEYLKYCLLEIKKIVKRYKLELNNKTIIHSIDEGFEFLGFKYIRKNNKLIVKVKNQTKKRFKRKMKNMYNLHKKFRIETDKVRRVKMSYLGHLKYGNTNNLIKKTLERYESSIYDDYNNLLELNSKITRIEDDGTVIIYDKGVFFRYMNNEKIKRTIAFKLIKWYD